jgi:hypothetical protein
LQDKEIYNSRGRLDTNSKSTSLGAYKFKGKHSSRADDLQRDIGESGRDFDLNSTDSEQTALLTPGSAIVEERARCRRIFGSTKGSTTKAAEPYRPTTSEVQSVNNTTNSGSRAENPRERLSFSRFYCDDTWQIIISQEQTLISGLFYLFA